eukprot:1696039-Prymnesium_polylepis.1
MRRSLSVGAVGRERAAAVGLGRRSREGAWEGREGCTGSAAGPQWTPIALPKFLQSTLLLSVRARRVSHAAAHARTELKSERRASYRGASGVPRPDSRSSTYLGLRLRCVMPWQWQCARARSTCRDGAASGCAVGAGAVESYRDAGSALTATLTPSLTSTLAPIPPTHPHTPMLALSPSHPLAPSRPRRRLQLHRCR